MGRQTREHSRGRVIGPDGLAMTLADLPGPDTKRWVPRRKAMVVAAVDGGLLSLDDVCRRYNLSIEEFFSWEDALNQHGLAGLRTTRSQKGQSTLCLHAVRGSS